jgi:hypothetical protein
MAVDASKIRVAGQGALWYAPTGTALPTDSTTALNAAFINLGYAQDGFEVDNSIKTKEIEGWQSAEVIKLVTTGVSRKVSFESLEMNKATVGLAWGGATITAGTGGAYTLVIPNAQLTKEFILVADWSDGTISQRIVIPRAALTALPKQKIGRQDTISFSFEVQALAPTDNSNSVLVYGVDAGVSA